MHLTVHHSSKWFWFDMWNTLGSWHDNARLVEACSRTYSDVSKINSDIQEEREKAACRIKELLYATK